MSFKVRALKKTPLLVNKELLFAITANKLFFYVFIRINTKIFVKYVQIVKRFFIFDIQVIFIEE